MQAICTSRPSQALHQPLGAFRAAGASRATASRRNLSPSRTADSTQQHSKAGLIARAAFSGAKATESVADIMTKGQIVTCAPETTVDDALELLVANRVTGLPVCDGEGKVVGVVSDFDLLALEGIWQTEKSEGLFPTASGDWDSFFEVQKLILKNEGKIVKDVMTAKPVCVRPEAPLEEAANLLLRLKIRRLPVVDEAGKLAGIISRGNIIAAALRARKAAKAAGAN